MTTNNHPAHGPVSLERLHQIREILSKASAQSDGGNLGYAMADAVKVIDGAIASFGSEPVLYAAEETLAYAKMGEIHLKCLSQPMGDAVIPLYTTPPAPLVPETLPCPVHLEPGLKFGKGVRTQCLMDALRRRADYYAELEAMTPEQRAEHDAGIAEFKAMIGNGGRGDMVDDDPQHAIHTAPTLYADGESAFPQRAMQSFGNSEQLDEVGSWNNHRNTPTAQAGNSPVTPNGWVMVPKEMTDAIGEAIAMHANCCGGIALDIYDAMLAAAPQQGVK
ncbi:hypothetical protein ACNPGY_02705 [Citrobacter cronae]|uniref:hypothetical protein n=1 Tax=Citrobacter cronae TaxID=1748967 RepID=UPI003AA8A14D